MTNGSSLSTTARGRVLHPIYVYYTYASCACSIFNKIYRCATDRRPTPLSYTLLNTTLYSAARRRPTDNIFLIYVCILYTCFSFFFFRCIRCACVYIIYYIIRGRGIHNTCMYILVYQYGIILSVSSGFIAESKKTPPRAPL